MSVVDWLPKLDLDSWTIAEGIVQPPSGDGAPMVRVGAGLVVRCDVLLDGAGSAPALEPGDRVLLTVSRDDPPGGVVLGKIVPGRPRSPEDREEQTTSDRQAASRLRSEGGRTVIEDREVVLRAGSALRIECGAGTIEIREDGKIVVKGEHLLSRARSTNRIKGGSVGIN
jgi:hypothetical protein